MQNLFLNLISQSEAPATILGVVIADGKFACKVRFGRGSNMAACTPWLKDKFMQWSKCSADAIVADENAAEFTVEIKLKG